MSSSNKPEKDKKEKKEELSEEDQALKDNIDNWVESFCEGDDEAFNKLDTEVRTATGTMTSLPRPFKFLFAHYQTLVDHFEKYHGAEKAKFADFMALVSMTLANPYEGQSLKYLRLGTGCDFTTWGQEFQLHISGDISNEYQQKLENKEDTTSTIAIAKKILEYFKRTNGVIDAIDLLIEIEQLDLVKEIVDEHTIRRIYDYLISNAPFASDTEEYINILKTAYNIAIDCKEYPYAMRVALKLDDHELISKTFNSCEDLLVKKQLAFALGRQRQVVDIDDEDLTDLMNNSRLSDFYIKLCEDLDLTKPKSAAEIYKSNLDEGVVDSKLDSAQANLAETYVNALVNLGTQKDTLMLVKDKEPWISNVKKEGIMAATASIGLIHLWNIDTCNEAISDYLDMKDGYAKAGACIGVGLASSGVWNEMDTAKALLEDSINSQDAHVKVGSCIGLGLAYAGTGREDFLETLTPIIEDTDIGPDTSGFAALSLGMIFVSKCDEEVSNAIISAMMNRPDSELDQASSRLFAVALALNFLGQQDKCEAAVETLSIIEHPLARFAEVCVQSAAYIGSGNILKLQELIQATIPHETDSAKTLPQSMSVIGIALIAMSEGVGTKMATRSLHHIFQYCELPVKRAVPIAIALLSISNPELSSIDLLTKLAHDEDAEMSRRAIFAFGLIGLGTNNAKISGILRGLATYYTRDPGHLYLIRISQGLLSAGKGLVTGCPFYSDGFLYSKVSMAGLFVIANCMLDTENMLIGKFNYSLYYLVCSLHPRMLFTLDENLENFPVNVRVGQAIDTVTLVGNPRAITGFQTHKSPVVLQYGERAELAEEEYIPVANVAMENIVIIKKNPEYEKEDVKPRKKTSASIYF